MCVLAILLTCAGVARATDEAELVAAKAHYVAENQVVPPTATSPPTRATAPRAFTAAPASAVASLPAPPAPDRRALWKRGWFWGAVVSVAVAGAVIGLGIGLSEQPRAASPTLSVTF